MAEIAGAICALLTFLFTQNCVNTPAVARCKFVVNPTKRFKELLRKKADILAHKDDVIRRLHKAEVAEGKKRSNIVMNWLKDVDRFLDETNGIEKKAKRTRRGMDRLLPNCWSRTKMGSNISRLLREAAELLARISDLSSEALTMSEEMRGIEFPVGKMVGEAIAHKTIEKVWGCLNKKQIGVVGVYGMGCVGKTTIVTEINNRLLGEKFLFDMVIWVTVSQSASIRQIQDKVSNALDHSLPETEDEKTISASLFRALKQRQKVVLILDDMWEEVSLEKIGIPEPTEENGCKILFTTRKLEVCTKMRCSTFKIKPLSRKKAWELFMAKVGIELGEEVKTIAENVVAECAGLPLAIVTVGGATRGNGRKNDWNIASSDLRDSKKLIIDLRDSPIYKYAC